MTASLNESLFDFLAGLTGPGFDGAVDRTALDNKLPALLKMLGRHTPNIDLNAAAVTLADATLATVASFRAQANTNYAWLAFMSYTAPTADDAQFKIVVPASTTGAGIAVHPAADLSALITPVVLGTAVTVGANTTAVAAVALGVARVAATAGDVSLQFAKAADAGADGSLAQAFILGVQI